MNNKDVAFDKTLRVAIKNTTGSQIAAGKAVAISSYDATNDLLLVQLADNATNKPAIGLTESAIDNGAVGTAIKYGLFPADTTGRTIGDLVYLGTSGNYTYSLPTGIVVRQELGRVAFVGASGWIYLFPKPYTPLAPGIPSYTTAFFDSSKAYLEYSSVSWQIATQVPFVGTDYWVPINFLAVLSRNGTSGTSELRLWDRTNSLEIAYVSWTASAIDIYQDSTLTNLPAGAAIFEVQIKTSAAAASKSRVHSVALY